MSRFSHRTFASRAWYQQTVCIVCQRWFCNIKNTDPKSRFYDTFQKPECYFRWLGDRADTPEAQAEYLAAPYQGEGRLKVGWRGKNNTTCGRCANAAMTPEAQAKHEKGRNKDVAKLRMRTMRAGRKAARAAAEAAAAPAPPTT